MLSLGRKSGTGDAEIFFAQEWQAQSQGAELLAPALDHAFSALKLGAEHIGRLAVVNGPGGFTGLRLAIVTAAALARRGNILQAPLPYMPLLASQAGIMQTAFGPAPASEIWVATHARRNLVHMQGFAANSALPATTSPAFSEPKEISPLLVLGLEEASSLLAGISGKLLVLGSGISRNREFFAEKLSGRANLCLLPESFEHPSPVFLLRSALALPDSSFGAADITPLYARTSDAEENLACIAAKLGLDAEKSRLRLEDLLTSPPKVQN